MASEDHTVRANVAGSGTRDSKIAFDALWDRKDQVAVGYASTAALSAGLQAELAQVRMAF